MNAGDVVAVFDQLARRWRRAVVIASTPRRVIVATRWWWAVVPARGELVRPVYVVEAAP